MGDEIVGGDLTPFDPFAAQSAAFLATLVESSIDAIIGKSLDGTITFWNAAAERLYGYAAEEALGRHVSLIVPPDDQADLADILERVRRGQRVARHRASRLRKDGTVITVSLSVSPVHGADGAIIGAATVAHDVTEQARAELELRQSEDMFSAAFHTTPDLMAITRAEDGRIIEVNGAYTRLLGYSREESLGKTTAELSIWLDAQERARFLSALEKQGGVDDLEVTLRTKDGRLLTCTDSARLFAYRGETCILSVAHDITARKRAELALRRLNRDLRAVLTCNQVLVRATDEQELLDGVCQVVCREAGYALAWVGYAEHDAARSVRPVASAGIDDGYLATADITWADEGRGCGVTGAAIRTGAVGHVQDFRTDETAAPWREAALARGFRSAIALPLMDDLHTPFGCLSIYATDPGAFGEDETRLLERLAADLAFGIVAIRTRHERERAQESLRASEEQFRTLAESTPDFIVRYDRQLRRTYVNPAWEESSGLAAGEVLGVPITEITGVPVPAAADYLAALRRVLASGTHERVEYAWVNARGETLTLDYGVVPEMDAQGDVCGVLCVGRDVTEQRRAEERLAAAAGEWRATFDAMRDAVALFDADGRLIRCNAATCALTGRSHADLLGRPCFEVFHGTSHWHEACPQLRARESGRAESTFLQQGDRWLRVDFQPLSDDQGRLTGGVHTVSDITELKDAEQAARVSESRFRSLFEDAPTAMWEEDHAAVKPRLEALRASGVGDLVEHFRTHRDEYAACLALAKTLDVNRAAVRLFGAADKAELIRRADEVSTATTGVGMGYVWEALLAGARSVSYEDLAMTLGGEPIEILETGTLAPGSEETWERVYFDDADITELKHTQAELEKSLSRLQSVIEEVVTAIADIVEARDPYTAGHERRVAELAEAIAIRMGLPEDRVRGVLFAGLLHDVGKVIVPSEILSKPGRLTAVEFELVKGHPKAGHDILSSIEFPWPVAAVTLQHHERLDGSGYPSGLSGEDIVLEARILAVADVVEAMASHRPYRPSLGVEAALEEITRHGGRLYDAAVVEACLSVFRDDGYSLD